MSERITLKQALYNHHLADELWKEYLLHKTRTNYENFVRIIGTINSIPTQIKELRETRSCR